MRNLIKIIKDTLIDYGLLGIKLFLSFILFITQTILIAYLYFVADIVYSFIQKYKEKKRENLSDEKSEEITKIAKKTKEDLDKLAKDQEDYHAKEIERKRSLVLLNKLLTESEVREKDLLSLTSTSEYYQLFVYSASLSRLASTLESSGFDKRNIPNRLYPVFLKKLGFARLGKNSQFFLINKKNLKDKKLTEIKEFKKFLMYHFSKIRREEWEEFINKLEEEDESKADQLREKGYDAGGYLKINFLLTESNMNVTNIGLVDGDHIGLGDVRSSEAINRQILIGADIRTESDKEDLKIRIKKVMDRQDIAFLLHEVSIDNKIRIESEQDSIKENLQLKNALDFGNTNLEDLKNELVRVGLNEEDSQSVSEKIINRAKEYQKALDNLQININS